MIGEQVQSIPSGGSLRRCVHHVYNPDLDRETAFHCELCRPQCVDSVDLMRAARFQMPTSSDERLSENDGALHANAHEGTSSTCPKCGSRIHYCTGENGEGSWVCAECSHKWKPPHGVKTFRPMVRIAHV